MNVLILGAGGREHALAWAIAKSPSLDRLACAPGNAGTERLAERVALDPSRPADVAAYCREHRIDLVVVGPEAPLVGGIAEVLRAEGLLVFGPGREGARIEGSKAFAKEVMRAEGIPAARSATVASVAEARKALEILGGRVAVKADGLAAGKGVVMAQEPAAALDAVRAAVEQGAFGEAGRRVVLEEWLEGEEASVIAFVDGEEVRPLAPSQDHKRAFDGDRGPNTGGMGAYAPYPPLAGEALCSVLEECVRPVARALARAGVCYRGVLYAGLMLTAEGPRVLEYNVRFGDPETQAILPLLGGDLLEVIVACARGELAAAPPFGVRSGSALTVVAASEGYPGAYTPGRVIEGLGEEDDRGNALIFHAGTRRREDGAIVTSGGRVLAVTGLGETLAEARQVAYDTLRTIRFEGMFARTDIGARGLEMPAAPKGETY